MSIRKPLPSTDLAAAEQKAADYESIFEHTPDHVIITDANAVILYANEAAGRESSFSPEEMKGMNPADLWGGQMPPEFYKNLWHTIKDRKQPFIGEVRNVRRDGSEHWQQLHITPLLNAEGVVEYFIGIEKSISGPSPQQAVFEKDTRQAALFFLENPEKILLVACGREGMAAYRAVTGGVQKLHDISLEKGETAMSTAFLNRCSAALAETLRHGMFDQVYLLCPSELEGLYTSIFKQLPMKPVSIIHGDYYHASMPELVNQVRLEVYRGF